MSLWWAKKNQLDPKQLDLIENLPIDKDSLILGPPGSGKTNILLRRAQYVRPQGLTRVLVLTFTRPLTEFIKTGCLDTDGAELFPRSAVSTYAAWINSLYDSHDKDRPTVSGTDLRADRAVLAKGAIGLVKLGKFPRYDTLFIDEAQDLLVDEINLLREWSDVLFFVGDVRQHIYGGSNGLNAVTSLVPQSATHILTFHYRIAPEICEVADKILNSQSGVALASTQHYNGPKPGIVLASGPLSRDEQLIAAINQIKLQMRAYGDLISEGDRIGIIVARRADRVQVFNALEADGTLAGRSQIVRARDPEEEGGYSPTLDLQRPILILTVAGCKGLEFRAVHWLFCDENTYYFQAEHYYTVVTRAKTRIDLYFHESLPTPLAAAYAAPVKPW